MHYAYFLAGQGTLGTGIIRKFLIFSNKANPSIFEKANHFLPKSFKLAPK